MSSQVPQTNAPQSQTLPMETGRGRVRRPTEKVQALIEEREQTKKTSERQAHDKAKRREQLTRKRTQVSKAAEMDPLMAPSLPPLPQGNVILSDNAFSSRPVGSVHATNHTSRPAMLSTALTMRKGRVPPRPNTVDQTPSRPGGFNTNTLRRQGTYLNVLEATLDDQPAVQTNIAARKRSRACDQTSNANRRNRVEVVETSDIDEQSNPPKKHMRYAVELSDDEDEPDDLMALSLTKSSSGADTKGGKPSTKAKAGDYSKGVRRILQTAWQLFNARLLSNNPYAGPLEEDDWAKEAWAEACDHHKVTITDTIQVIRLITERSSHLRSRFKTQARLAVAAEYGFTASGEHDVVEKNCILFGQLKAEGAFTFRHRGRTVDDHTGVYMNPSIQQVIENVLFKHKNDEGILWSKYYKPFPLPGFALAVTAIECAIDEWETGALGSVNFKESEYSGVFDRHLKLLERFQALTASFGLMTKMLQKVYTDGRAHAGLPAVITQSREDKKGIPERAFLNAIREYQMEEGIRAEPITMTGHVEVEAIDDPEDLKDDEDMEEIVDMEEELGSDKGGEHDDGFEGEEVEFE